MEQTERSVAILFADVCDSTRLYEQLGDVRARSLVSQCLTTLESACKLQNGQVIKTMGDGIMMTFDSADHACLAAMEMQQNLEGGELAIRVGFHFGPVIENNGDVFGDAVNLASRIDGLGKPHEILTTEDTVNALTSVLKETTRYIDRATVKGKKEPVSLYEVIWQNDDADVTMATTRRRSPLGRSNLTLVLSYSGEDQRLTLESNRFVIGRRADCDMVVASEWASRVHAVIESTGNRFTLIDQSTNGTYVFTPDTPPILLKRDGMQLIGEGGISLGDEQGDKSPHLIHFRCES